MESTKVISDLFFISGCSFLVINTELIKWFTKICQSCFCQGIVICEQLSTFSWCMWGTKKMSLYSKGYINYTVIRTSLSL